MIETASESAILASMKCPYPGLRAFRQSEAPLFFGRDEQIDGLIERLAEERLVVIAGDSGCGKSSLVRAGLLPALDAGFLHSAGEKWLIADLRPGYRPMYNLAVALATVLPSSAVIDAALLAARLRYGPRSMADILADFPLPSGTELLIVVDQFEELIRFRERSDPNEADAFVALLLETVTNPRLPVRIVLTLRTDYLGACAIFPGLPEALNGSQYLVPRLKRDQLRDIIINPARVFDGDVDPRLANRLINEVSHSQDQLPVLEHALLAMWTRPRDLAVLDPDQPPAPGVATIHLALADYEALGGLGAALSRRADEAYHKLGSPQKQRIASRLFCALWDEAASGRDTRRPCTVQEAAEFAGVSTAELREVVEVFRNPEHSFLMPPPEVALADDAVLDVVHESLFRHWKLLRKWIVQEADDAKQYRVWLAETDAHEQFDGDLLNDKVLERIRAWQDALRPTAGWARRYSEQPEDFAKVQRFVRSSQIARTIRQWARRAFALVGVVALCASMYWLAHYREQRAREAQHAEAQRQQIYSAAAFGSRLEPVRALQLALEAQGDDHNPQSGAALRTALRASHLRSVVFPSAGNFDDARFLDDARIVTVGEADGLAIWDVHTGRRLDAAYGAIPRKLSLHVSARATLAATASDDGTVDLWDLSSVPARHLWTQRRQVTPITDVAFSPDGTRFATASRDGTAVLWDVAAGAPLPPMVDHLGGVLSLAFSHDGQRLATVGEDARLVLWDASSGRKLRLFARLPHAAAISFDATDRLVAASGDGGVTLWDPITQREEGVLSHRGAVTAVAFSPDGRRIATTSVDDTLRVWDAATRTQRFWTSAKVSLHDDGRPATELGATHDVEPSGPKTVAFAPDGRALVTTGRDGCAKIWDVEAGGELVTFRAHEQAIRRIAYAPGGTRIATASDDGSTVVWDLSGRSVLRFSAALPVRAIGFNADGTKLAISHGAQVTLWMLGPVGAPDFSLTMDSDVQDLRVFQHRERIAVAAGHEIAIWSRPGNRPEFTIDARVPVRAIAISPDDEIIASECADDTGSDEHDAPHPICLWNARTGTALTSPGPLGTGRRAQRGRRGADTAHRGPILALQFAADGTWLASSSEDRTIRIWDIRTGKPLATLSGHRESITGLAISRDGAMLASSGDDLVRLWNAQSYITQDGFPDAEFGSDSVEFSPDGSAFAAGGRDGVVRVYAVGSDALRPLARDRTPVHLTESECLRYVDPGCREPRTTLQLANEGRHLLHTGQSFYGDRYLAAAAARDPMTFGRERDRFASARQLQRAIDAIAAPLRAATAEFTNASRATEDGSEQLGRDLAVAKLAGVRRGTAILALAAQVDPSLALQPEALATRVAAQVLSEQAYVFARKGREPWAEQALLLTPPAGDDNGWAANAATTMASAESIRLVRAHLDRGETDKVMNALRGVIDTLPMEHRPAQLLVLLRLLTAGCEAAHLPGLVVQLIAGLYKDVDDVEVLTDFAAAFLRSGMEERATAVIDRALSIDPTNDLALLLLAHAQEGSGQLPKALGTLNSISPMTPLYRDVAAMAGRIAYDKLERLRDGYRWLGIAIGLHDSTTWGDYAEAAWANSRFVEARLVARRVLDARGAESPGPYVELAMRFVLLASLCQSGDYEAADRELDVVLEHAAWHPTDGVRWKYTGSHAAVARIKNPHHRAFLHALLEYAESMGKTGDPGQLRKLLHDTRDAAR
jgi:WD40 repeat protein/energy-coupling factor transporter ATP-binding protein EcfA2